MTESVARDIINRYEAKQNEGRTPVEKAIQSAKSAAMGGTLLTATQCTVILSQMSGRNYNWKTTPVYKALGRGMLQSTISAGVRFVTLDSFIKYLKQFKARIEDKPIEGETE